MYSYKKIIQVAYPILLSLLAQNVVNVTDTAFLGRLGEVELGASAIAGVFYLMMFMLGIGFSQGLQIFIGRRNGEKNYTQIGALVSNGATVMMLFAVVLFCMVFTLIEPALRIVMQSERVCDAAIQFMNIRIFGLFFIFPNILMRTFFIATQQTKTLIWNALVMASTNVVLDYGLIFGKLGLPEMGLEGAALASVISEAVASTFFLGYIYIKVDRAKYDIRLRFRFDHQLIRSIFSVSIFLMLQIALSFAPWAFFFIGIEQLGERPLAISNLLRSLYMIFFIPIDSLAIATSTIVTNTIGAGNKRLVLKNVNRIIKMGLIAMIPLVLISFSFPNLILSIYTSDPTLISESIAPLYTLATCVLPAVMGRIYFQGISGTGNTRAALWIEIFTIVVYSAYMVWIVIIERSPVWLCWTVEHVYWSLLGVICFLYLRSNQWQHKKI